MHRTLRAALATALFALPQLASAGPIEWNSRATVTGANGGWALDAGAATLFDYDPTTGSDLGPFYFYLVAPLPGALTTPPQTGNVSRMRVAVLSNSDGLQFIEASEAPPPGGIDPAFVLSFALTDTASGESGTVTFDGRVSASTGNFIGMPYLMSVSVDEGDQVLTLGGNRYTVSMHRGPSETAEWIEADVSALAAAPEPGTLALAALGLCALGVVRRARRRTPGTV